MNRYRVILRGDGRLYVFEVWAETPQAASLTARFHVLKGWIQDERHPA